MDSASSPTISPRTMRANRRHCRIAVTDVEAVVGDVRQGRTGEFNRGPPATGRVADVLAKRLLKVKQTADAAFQQRPEIGE